MAAAQRNALAIVDYLKQQPLVKKLYHPSLPENAGHQFAARQQRGFGQRSRRGIADEGGQGGDDAHRRTHHRAEPLTIGGDPLDAVHSQRVHSAAHPCDGLEDRVRDHGFEGVQLQLTAFDRHRDGRVVLPDLPGGVGDLADQAR